MSKLGTHLKSAKQILENVDIALPIINDPAHVVSVLKKVRRKLNAEIRAAAELRDDNVEDTDSDQE